MSEMAAEAERRLALMPELPTPGKPPAESAAAQKPEGAAPTKESAKEGPATPGSPNPAPEAAAAQDLSFVSEEHRSFFEKAPQPVLDYLRALAKEEGEGKLRWADYTKKTTAVAEQEKALSAREKAAQFGEAIWQDPEALDALRALERKRNGAEASPASKTSSKPFWTEPHTEEEWETHFAERDARVAKQAVEQALRAVHGERESETQAQREFREMGLAAKSAFVDSGEYTGEQVDELYLTLKADGVKFTKDNVVATLRKYLPAKAPAKEQPKQDSPHGTTAPKNGTSGASALTRHTGTGVPVKVPQFMLEGRQITNDSPTSEKVEEAMHEWNQRRIARGEKPWPVS